MLGSMYARFGGLSGFVETYWNQFTQAPAGGNQQTKLLLLIVHLTELDSARRDAESKACKREYSVISDEELEEERMALMSESIVKILAAQPQLAVWAAEQLGWTVIPPPDVE